MCETHLNGDSCVCMRISMRHICMCETHLKWHTANCIWNIISSFSNLNRSCSFPGLFYHVPLKRDHGDWDWRLRWNDTLNAIGCIFVCMRHNPSIRGMSSLWMHIHSYVRHTSVRHIYDTQLYVWDTSEWTYICMYETQHIHTSHVVSMNAHTFVSMRHICVYETHLNGHAFVRMRINPLIRVMSCLWMHIHWYLRATTHSWIRHDSFVYRGHDSFIYTWLIRMYWSWPVKT